MVRGSFEHAINQAIVGKATAIYNHLPKGAATTTVAGKCHRSERRDKCIVQSIVQVSATQGMDGGASSWVALRTRGSTQQKHHRHYSIRTRVDRHGFRFLIWPVWVIHCELDRWRRSRRTLLGPWFDPVRGRTRCVPSGPGLLGLLYLESPYFSPPRSGLVGLAFPWRVRLWSVRPWLASPGGSGVPSLCLCFFPPFLCFCFVPSSGSARVSRVVELPWPSMAQVWQRVCTRSFEATAQVFRKEPPPATRTPPTFDQNRKRK